MFTTDRVWSAVFTSTYKYIWTWPIWDRITFQIKPILSKNSLLPTGKFPRCITFGKVCWVRNSGDSVGRNMSVVYTPQCNWDWDWDLPTLLTGSWTCHHQYDNDDEFKRQKEDIQNGVDPTSWKAESRNPLRWISLKLRQLRLQCIHAIETFMIYQWLVKPSTLEMLNAPLWFTESVPLSFLPKTGSTSWRCTADYNHNSVSYMWWGLIMMTSLVCVVMSLVCVYWERWCHRLLRSWWCQRCFEWKDGQVGG